MTTPIDHEAFHASLKATLERCQKTIESCEETRKSCVERAEKASSDLEERWTEFNKGFVELQLAMVRKFSPLTRSALTSEEMRLSAAEQRQLMIEERTEKVDIVARKVKELASLISNSNKFVVWTGAGISTNSGIPDYRGPEGKWTLKEERRLPKAPPSKSSCGAIPTSTHFALQALLNCGKLKRIISTNTDGLHLRSGVAPNQLVELHGNTNKLRCSTCSEYHFIDDRARVAKDAKKHETSHICTKCGGVLYDTIINFGEVLHPEVQEEAKQFSSNIDVLLVLGSSLRVITAPALEEAIQRKQKIIIVNKQRTPYDNEASIRIFADCDVVMTLLMNHLGVETPPPSVTRYCRIRSFDGGVSFQGMTVDGHPYHYARSVSLLANDSLIQEICLTSSRGLDTITFDPVPQEKITHLCVSMLQEEVRHELPCIIKLAEFDCVDVMLSLTFSYTTQSWVVRPCM